MENVDKLKKEITSLKDSEKINDILLQLSKNITQEVIPIVDFLVTELDSNQLNKINLNLVFLIGELGNIMRLEQRYLDYLVNSYYKSDRWVRNEIIQAIFKILKFRTPDKFVLNLIEDGLKEDYEPIQENSLRVLTLYDDIPTETLRVIILMLKPIKSDLIELAVKILTKSFKNEEEIFKFLDYHQNYRIFDKERVRIILTEFLSTIQQLENFQKRITDSNWEDEIKILFLQEIMTLERIILKR